MIKKKLINKLKSNLNLISKDIYDSVKKNNKSKCWCNKLQLVRYTRVCSRWLPLFSIYRRNIIFTTSVPSEFYNHDPWQRIEVQIGFGNSCPATCFQTRGHRFLMPIFQLLVYHGKNKSHFNEMMMKSALH